MGCACRKAGAARSTPPPAGYKVTFPDGTSETYLTDLEARRAVRKAGGGTVRACKTGDCLAS